MEEKHDTNIGNHEEEHRTNRVYGLFDKVDPEEKKRNREEFMKGNWVKELNAIDFIKGLLISVIIFGVVGYTDTHAQYCTWKDEGYSAPNTLGIPTAHIQACNSQIPQNLTISEYQKQFGKCGGRMPNISIICKWDFKRYIKDITNGLV